MDANSAEEFDLDASTWNIIEKQLKTLYPVADVPTGIETILYSLAKVTYQNLKLRMNMRH